MGRGICGEPGCGAALYPGDEGGVCFTCAARRRAAGRAERRSVSATALAAVPAAVAQRETAPAAPAPSEAPRGPGPTAVPPPPSPPPARDAAPSRRPGRPPFPPEKRRPRTSALPRPCMGPGCERVVTGHRASVLCPSCAARKRAAEQRARRAEASPEPPAPTVCAEPGCDTQVKRSTTGYCASHAASRAAKRRPRIRPTVCQHRGCEVPISRWSKSGRCRRHALRVRPEEITPAP